MWKLAICLGVVLVRKTVNGFFKLVLHVCGVQIYSTSWCRNLKPRIPIKIANVWGPREATVKLHYKGLLCLPTKDYHCGICPPTINNYKNRQIKTK